MKTKIIYIIASFLAVSFMSCDEDAIFQKELYDKYLYLVSDNDQIHNLLYSLDEEMSINTVSIGCSGTKHVEKDVRITLEKDHELLDTYNYSNFDIDVSKYARELKEEDFDMPSMTAFIKLDAVDPYTTLPITIGQKVLDGLSPDSIYFIPLAIRDVSEYQINKEKHNVLCQIHTYNKYANSKELTQYTMKGYRTISSGTASISGAKNLQPLTRNTVRIFAGNSKFNRT